MRAVAVCIAVLSVLAFHLAAPTIAEATPRMSAASGAPCTTCHYSSDGGGIRSEVGFGNQIDNVAFDYEDLGINFLAEQDTNFLADWLAVGVDTRVQAARLGQPQMVPADEGEPGELETRMPDRQIFPMQFQPRVAVFPNEWLTVLASWAVGPGMLEEDADIGRRLCSGTYDGQMCGEIAAQFDFDPSLPNFHAGLFRPNIGIRHDDHTMLVDADASRPRTEVIPPNYAELGVEGYYQPRHWFRADAGVYRSDQLADALNDSEMVQPGDPAALARVTLYHPFEAFEESFFSWAGVSTYASGHLRGEGNFRTDKAFFGLGMLDRGSLLLDIAHLDFRGADTRRGFNASTTLSVELLDWLVAHTRVEQATTWREASDTAQIRQQAVAGVQVYPIPFVKLQPEYRYTRTNDWHMGQYAVQLHMFF